MKQIVDENNVTTILFDSVEEYFNYVETAKAKARRHKSKKPAKHRILYGQVQLI